MLKLLIRMYNVKSGSITLDDIDIKNIKLRDLRKHIAIVPQEAFLAVLKLD